MKFCFWLALLKRTEPVLPRLHSIAAQPNSPAQLHYYVIRFSPFFHAATDRLAQLLVLLLSGDFFFLLQPASRTAPFRCISILLQQPHRQTHSHTRAEGAPYIMSESGGAPWESGRRAVCFRGGVSQRSCRESEQRRIYNAALQIALHQNSLCHRCSPA